MVPDVTADERQHGHRIAAHHPDLPGGRGGGLAGERGAQERSVRQSQTSVTKGTVVARRPPKKIAEIGPPWRSSHPGARIGHWETGV
jgi:hypothetical protein